VSSRIFIVASACLAVALGGCSLTPSSTSNTAGFTGVQGLIASQLNKFASDASSDNPTDLCTNVLASSVVDKLNRSGGCKTDITNQLKTIDDFSLTVKTVNVKGATATAAVQTVQNGKKVIGTMSLVRESGVWKVLSGS